MARTVRLSGQPPVRQTGCSSSIWPLFPLHHDADIPLTGQARLGRYEKGPSTIGLFGHYMSLWLQLYHVQFILRYKSIKNGDKENHRAG